MARHGHQDFLKDILDAMAEVRALFAEEFGGPIPAELRCGKRFRSLMKKQVRHRPKIDPTEAIFGIPLVVSDSIPRDVALLMDHHGNVLQIITLKERPND